MDLKLRMNPGKGQRTLKLITLGGINRSMTFKSWEVISLNTGTRPEHWSQFGGTIYFAYFFCLFVYF